MHCAFRRPGSAYRIGIFVTPSAKRTDRMMEKNSGPLAGLRILDLSRILAGPTCTQLLGDLGAEVIKIERPGVGDDTRIWGPPYVKDAAGRETRESAYYLCANRNKKSVAVDLAKPGGAALIRQLAGKCDILIENFKVGGLAKYGLGYDHLKDANPRLVYCSITGFGQTGPYASRPGYDALIQAMGGIMSITGQPEGEPTKVGVGIADIMCGMYATVSILSAIHHRDQTGRGQYIDVALFDTQISWLINFATNYFVSGQIPSRMGNAHPNVLPYQVFETLDDHVLIACGNDGQFERFCVVAGAHELCIDPRFSSNSDRIRHRDALIPVVKELVKKKPRDFWIAKLAKANVPCGPVNDIGQVFADPQAVQRQMSIVMDHPVAGDGQVRLIGNPIKMSETPVSYRHAPPLLGENTNDVLGELLGLDGEAISRLRERGIVGVDPMAEEGQQDAER
jgi:crotonobetainyl-CoA:carnitine CoA-transferase CaiB-like acyl-CoA transferase